MSSGRDLDRLARDLATGEISRRSALARLVGGAVAVGVASLPGAQALASRRAMRCPQERRCGERCCPQHSKCRKGRCKCKSGYSKCGRKCVDLDTSAKHCGGCGQACAEGETCLGGECQAASQCSTPDECPPPGECKTATCVDGTCGAENAPYDQACSSGVCDGQGNCVQCNTADQCPPDCNISVCLIPACFDGTCGCGSAPGGYTCYSECCNPGYCTSPDGYCLCDNPIC